MSKEEFIKNNWGINDNVDFFDEYFFGIFDDIVSNEIVFISECEVVVVVGIFFI